MRILIMVLLLSGCGSSGPVEDDMVNKPHRGMIELCLKDERFAKMRQCREIFDAWRS